MGSSQRSLVLSLYRQLLKESANFDSYNFRSYALRKVKDTFRSNANITDCSRINSLIKEGQDNLAIVKRQVILGKMYPSEQLVIEK